MKIETAIEDILNKQIKYEFEAAYSYLGLAAALNTTPYVGFSHWMKKQYEEELTHAMKLYEYIQTRQGCVKLQNFDCPTYYLKTPLEAFQLAYDLEIENTRHIHEAYYLATQKEDLPTQILLQWFINEQVEEENNCQTFIEKLKLAQDCTCSLLALDQEAGKR